MVKPTVESCNGKDDDCDGSVDEDVLVHRVSSALVTKVHKTRAIQVNARKDSSNVQMNNGAPVRDRCFPVLNAVMTKTTTAMAWSMSMYSMLAVSAVRTPKKSVTGKITTVTVSWMRASSTPADSVIRPVTKSPGKVKTRGTPVTEREPKSSLVKV